MGIFDTLRRPTLKRTAQKLYLKVVEQARRPEFYLRCGAPDTIDGRFDMIVLHAFLLMRRLKRNRAPSDSLAQALFDCMFANMDENLREMGVGDMGVGRRVKDMARAFYGRVAAYESGLDGDDRVLGDALRRNLFRGITPDENAIEAMVGYVRREAAALDDVEFDSLLAGDVAFGAAPELREEATR